MGAEAETYEFKSEARQLLDLMIHSLYSNKEIFLRELISNASDALDKLRFEAITDKSLRPEGTTLRIRISADKEKRTLTVDDNGIGMSHDEVVRNLGTIAHSGTREFAAQIAEAKKAENAETLIGQFGVGFYSSFMVADEVTVITRRAGSDEATRWHSKGDGHFDVAPGDRDSQGTTVILHLREADPENALPDYTEEWTLRSVIKKYSDFVQYPVELLTERTEKVETETEDEDEEPEEKTVTEWQTVNSMKAIWTRDPADVEDEEYAEFYKHISHDWEAPFETISFKAEGLFEYHALLFIPDRAPFDLFYREQKYGLQLYVNRVLIMERCEDLLPDWLRFVKGVVDSPDLTLNVSREMLQQDRRVDRIRKKVVKKVLDTLEQILKEDRERYLKFWGDFGRVLKEGTTDPTFGEKLHPLLMFQSSNDRDSDEKGALTTLGDYVERMKEEQEAIYYITGESRAAVERSPHLEAFYDKGYEVLFLTDPVDEIMVGHLREFDGKPLKSVGKGTVELGSEEERKEKEEKLKEKEETYASLLELMQKQLDEHVKEVRFSTRLTSSPVCLVGDEFDMSPGLQKLLQQANQEMPEQKRILELNPDHDIVTRMKALYDERPDDAKLADYTQLLFGQALIAEGSPLPDPVGFAQKVAKLMVQAG